MGDLVVRVEPHFAAAAKDDATKRSELDGFSKLGPDVQRLLLRFMPFSEICRLSYVSRRWHVAIDAANWIPALRTFSPALSEYLSREPVGFADERLATALRTLSAPDLAWFVMLCSAALQAYDSSCCLTRRWHKNKPVTARRLFASWIGCKDLCSSYRSESLDR